MPRSVPDILQKVFRILEYIQKEGEANQLKISRDLGIRYQTVGDYLDYLESLGLVKVEITRTAPPLKKVTLTQKGMCIAACIKK